MLALALILIFVFTTQRGTRTSTESFINYSNKSASNPCLTRIALGGCPAGYCCALSSKGTIKAGDCINTTTSCKDRKCDNGMCEPSESGGGGDSGIT